MAQDNPYVYNFYVESFMPSRTSGLHGAIHIRPVEGERYPQTMRVECSKILSEQYPVGTKFKLAKVKLTDREGRGEYLYSRYNWKYEVISEDKINA